MTNQYPQPAAYLEQYKKDHTAIRWAVPPEFSSSKEVVNRDLMGKHLLSLSAAEIVKYYAYNTFEEMEEKKRLFDKYVKLKGVGIESGAGCGVMSSIFAKDPNVDFILAVEVVESMTEQILPKVSKGYLGAAHEKVVPVTGTFDTLEVADNSIDFVVEIDSLHHSHNLEQSFKESYRVLKKGGQMVFLDRCHPNTLTDEKVNEMLNVVYSKEWLEHNFYPNTQHLTRRENGENEYREFEWQQAISKAGFKLKMLKKLYRPVSTGEAARNLVGYLRDSVFGKRFNANGASLREFNIFLSQKLGVEMPVKGEFPSLPFSDELNHVMFILEK